MQSKRVFYFILTVALVGLACGIGQGFPDFSIPFIPTKTNTPQPANTATVTPTFPPKPGSSSEAFEVEVLENETTIFIDKTLGYQLRFPVEWLVIPLDEDGQTDFFEAVEAELPESLAELLETTRKQAGVRMLALDYTMKYSSDDKTAGNIKVVFQESTAVQEVEMDALLEENVEALPTLIPDSNVTYQAVQTNPNGIEYAKLVVSHPAETFGVPLKQMMVMVKLEGGLLTVTGTVPEEMYFEVEHVFQRVFDSLAFTE